MIPPLLASFQLLEGVLVAAESLSLRLPGEPVLAGRVLAKAASELEASPEEQMDGFQGTKRIKLLRLSSTFSKSESVKQMPRHLVILAPGKCFWREDMAVVDCRSAVRWRDASESCYPGLRRARQGCHCTPGRWR